MKEREYILELYELYNKLLTNKEIDYFKDYYFEDYSLQEIADNNDVSKSYVSKIINSIEKKLIRFEELLNIYKKNNKIRNIINNLDKDIKDKIEEIL